MKSVKIMLSLILILRIGLSDAAENYPADYGNAAKPLDYIIGPEDILHIFVWQHPELSTDVVVRPDGRISFPIIDDVDAEGLTPSRLDETITRRLTEFIKSPQVTVMVKSFSSKKICILGEVTKPGIYPVSGRLTIVEAMAMANYAKKSAVLESVVLIRPGPEGKAGARRVDLNKVIKDGSIEENIVLKPGDIIFVPKSFISSLDDFLEFFTSKIQPSIQWYFLTNV